MRALVPGLYFLLPGVPATGDFLGMIFFLGDLVLVMGVEVETLLFTGAFMVLPFKGLLLC